MAMAPQTRDLVIRTILGEADPSPEGQAAVANVIKNRALSGVWGDPYSGGTTNTIKAYKQFSMWNQDDPKLLALAARTNAIPTTDPKYQRAGQIADGVFSGQIGDNTNGATHYYAPSGMPGGQPPDWARNQQGRQIGTQFFYKLPLTSANTAGSGVTSPSSAPPPGASPADAQAARAYLASLSQHTDRAGDTANLNPDFAVKMANAIKQANAAGLNLSVMSAYRTPGQTGLAYDAGGNSSHSYGLAVDVAGLDGPNGAKTQAWAKIAQANGLSNPYGVGDGAEFNHWQLPSVPLEQTPQLLAQLKAAAATGDFANVWAAYRPGGQTPQPGPYMQTGENAAAAPTSTAPPPPPLYMGDSRGVGMSMAGPKGETTAVEGQGPDKVLNQILSYKGGFAGRDIYLSPGTANIMANGQWDQATFDHSGMANINAQLAALKAGGADMSRVHVLGVPNGYGGDYANAQVKALTDKYGAQTNVLASQELHPGADGYKEVFAGAAAAPAAYTQPTKTLASPPAINTAGADAVLGGGTSNAAGTGQNPPAGFPGAPDPNARFQVLTTMGQGGRPGLPYTALNLTPGAGATQPLAASAPAAPVTAPTPAPAPAPTPAPAPAPAAPAPTLTPTSTSGPIGTSASTAPIGSPLSSVLPTFGASNPDPYGRGTPTSGVYLPGSGGRIPATTEGGPSMGYPALGADTDQPSAPMASMPPPLFASAQNLLKLLFSTG